MTKLSSAGLVYLHFGRQLLAQLTQLKEDDRQLEVLYDKVKDDGFIAGSGLATTVFYSQHKHSTGNRCFPLASLVSETSTGELNPEHCHCQDREQRCLLRCKEES